MVFRCFLMGDNALFRSSKTVERNRARLQCASTSSILGFLNMYYILENMGLRLLFGKPVCFHSYV